MRRLIAASLVALVALAVPAVPAQAGLMISGDFEGDGVLAPTEIPFAFVQNLTGEGDDTTLGPFTIQAHSMLDFSHPPFLVIPSGMASLIFPEGTLFGTSSGMGAVSGHGTATFEADLVITGGTGLFAGATGDVTITGTITSTGPTTDSVTASYVGSLSGIPFAVVPEPSSLALLALGGLGLAGWRRWKRRTA